MSDPAAFMSSVLKDAFFLSFFSFDSRFYVRNSKLVLIQLGTRATMGERTLQMSIERGHFSGPELYIERELDNGRMDGNYRLSSDRAVSIGLVFYNSFSFCNFF